MQDRAVEISYYISTPCEVLVCGSTLLAIDMAVNAASDVRGYKLGPTAFRITTGKGYRQEIVRVASPIIEARGRELNEYVNLVLNRNGTRHRLLHVEPDREIVLKPEADISCDLYRHATGLILLAHMPPQDRKRYYKDVGAPTVCPVMPIDSVAAFEAECTAIRERGYLEVPYGHAGGDAIVVLAFPVTDGTLCDMAVGVQVPRYRFDAVRRKTILLYAPVAAAHIADAYYGQA